MKKMGQRLILALCTFVLVINVASCAYQPWEEIKKWYNSEEYQYNRNEADARHSEMLKNCTAAVGENEEICFDECMFRNQYQLIELVPPLEEIGFVYWIYAEHGLKNLEKNVLQLKGAEDNQPKNNIFNRRFLSCKNLLSMNSEINKKLHRHYLDATKCLCTLVVNGKEKETMVSIVNCAKKAVTKIDV